MSDWPTLRLGDLAQWLSGGTPNTAESSYWGGDIPWISAASLKEFFIASSDRNVTTEGAANGTRLVPPGTTIFIVRGMSLMSEFRIGITTREVAFGQDCKALIPGQGIDPTFLVYAIKAQTSKILELVDAAGHGTGRLQTDRIANLLIPIPCSTSEQQRTTAALKALDDKIALNDRVARAASDLAQARHAQLDVRSAKSMSVGDLISLEYGKSLPAGNRTAGEVPVYGSGGKLGTHTQALVSGPGIIVGRKGTVGAVYWSEEDFFPIDTTFYVQPRSSLAVMEFVYFTLRSLGLNGMNSDSAVPGLNRSHALALLVRVPDQTDTNRFSDGVRPIFALRNALAMESSSLAQLRDTLLPKLMSGEIPVREAEEMMAKVT